jgi:SAM-dependent methyltransferase
MRGRDTDLEWERFGATDPYFGVITDPRYHRANLTGELRDEFFASGARHVAHVLDTIRRHICSDFAPRRVLDFGCGVGRLAIPFARLSAETVGVDVSASMLAEATRNAQERGAPGLRLIRSDDALTGVDGSFDLVHSFIVFQHIPVARGMVILDRLLERIGPRGIGALHFTYGFRRGSGAARRFVKSWIPCSSYLINLARRRPLATPVMQMNRYDLNEVLGRIAAHGATVAHVELTDHGGALGIVLYFAAR